MGRTSFFFFENEEGVRENEKRKRRDKGERRRTLFESTSETREERETIIQHFRIFCFLFMK